MSEHRVGLGFDTHTRTGGRRLFLAGVEFSGEEGLQGHSDGDVVCHALADAMLGAAALGDIGEHFPDDDPSVAGISGPDLLRRTVELLERSGFALVRCDLVIIAERPHLSERREEMRKVLAEVLGVDPGEVSVKATRPEGLGLSGDGVGCMAIATIA